VRARARAHFNERKHKENAKTKQNKTKQNKKAKEKGGLVVLPEPAQAWSDPNPTRQGRLCKKKTKQKNCKKVEEFFFQRQKLREYNPFYFSIG
jgi:hypothetical protein